MMTMIPTDVLGRVLERLDVPGTFLARGTSTEWTATADQLLPRRLDERSVEGIARAGARYLVRVARRLRPDSVRLLLRLPYFQEVLGVLRGRDDGPRYAADALEGALMASSTELASNTELLEWVAPHLDPAELRRGLAVAAGRWAVVLESGFEYHVPPRFLVWFVPGTVDDKLLAAALRAACVNGRLDIADRLVDGAGPDAEPDAVQVLQGALLSVPEAVRWAVDRLGVEAEQAHRACGVIGASADLGALRWVHGHFRLPAPLARSLLVGAASSGGEMVRWLVDAFGLDGRDPDEREAFRRVCRCGFIEVARFLRAAFSIRRLPPGLFEEVCQCGRRDVAEWLAERLRVPPPRILTTCHLDLLSWVVERFRITSAEPWVWDRICRTDELPRLKLLAPLLTPQEAWAPDGPVSIAIRAGSHAVLRWLGRHYPR
jgi:hypothetical protein